MWPARTFPCWWTSRAAPLNGHRNGHRMPRPADLRTREWPEEYDLDEDLGAEESASAHFVPIQMEGDGPLVVREKLHPAEPMTIDQALLADGTRRARLLSLP